MVFSGAAAALPILAELKLASERWVRRERARARLASGSAALDALLGGGWPQGKVGELVGPASSGRSAVAAATVAAATARGEVAAWLDAADAFDPASAAAAGVDLGRVLWVRPRDAVEAVRAAELVLETGGFTVVVLDLGAAVLDGRTGRVPEGAEEAGPVAGGRWPATAQRTATAAFRSGRPPGGRPSDGVRGATSSATHRSGFALARGQGLGALRLRLARAVERADAVALVLAERPWAGTLAGATVALRRGGARWDGERGGPRWLEGLVLRAQVERGAACAAPVIAREPAAVAERGAPAAVPGLPVIVPGVPVIARGPAPGAVLGVPVIARSPGEAGAEPARRMCEATEPAASGRAAPAWRWGKQSRSFDRAAEGPADTALGA